MGHLWTRLFKHKDVRILLLGLDSGGKTTILYRLKLDEVVTTVPTIGFNVESIQYRDLHFTAWDIGSRDKIRPLFRHYYKGADAVVFVVDSHDPERLDELNYDVIKPAMNAEELKEAVFLFLANKVDLSHTISVEEIAERLGLQYLKHTWNILPVSAVTGEGLYTALDWLSMKLGSIQARRALEAPPSPASTNSPAVNVDCVEPTSTLHSTSGKTGPNTGDRSCKTGPNTDDRSCKTGPNTGDRSCKTGPNTDDRSCKTGLSPRSSVQGGTETASASGPDNVELQVRGDYCARAYSAIKCFFFRSNRQGRQASPDTISTSSQD